MSITNRSKEESESKLNTKPKMNMNQPIYNYHLRSTKYDEATLIVNLPHLNKNTILNTQKLSEEFCAKYIFCIDDIDDGDEDSYLFDLNHILNRQPHLNKEKLEKIIDDLSTSND